MSKKTHQKELARARAKRRSSLEAKQRRTKVIAVTVILAMALSLFAVALFSRDQPGGVTSYDGGGDGTQAADPDGAIDPAEASYANPQPVDAEPCPPGSASDVAEPDAAPRDAAPEPAIDEDATYLVTITTTCGDIVLELDPSVAPVTVNNFVTLAEDGYYDGVPFHRVINGFMIQGGDPTGTGTGCLNDDCSERLPGYTFTDELEHATALVEEHGGYPRGTVAMANAGPDTNGSQFFIVQGQPGYPLPPQYTAFGTVTEGMDVVDRIAQGPAEEQLAVDPVRIVSVAVSES